jgi:hypothetical protein
MRPLLTLALVAMAALTGAAADLAGAWKGAMQTQMGETGVSITLKAGDAVEGTVKVNEYDAPISKGRLDGGKIYFEMNIEHGRLIFDGTVAGDEMKFTVTGTQGDKYPLTCKRQK